MLELPGCSKMVLLEWAASEAFEFDCGLIGEFAIARNNGDGESNGGTEPMGVTEEIRDGLSSLLGCPTLGIVL